MFLTQKASRMNTPLMKDLQQVATLSAILLEGRDEKHLTSPERELVEKLTALGYIIPDTTPKGFVGEARRPKPPAKH